MISGDLPPHFDCSEQQNEAYSFDHRGAVNATRPVLNKKPVTRSVDIRGMD